MIPGLLLVALLNVVSSQSCQPYTGELCGKIIPSSAPIFLEDGATVDIIEQDLVKNGFRKLLENQEKAPECISSYVFLLCHSSFPTCANSTGVPRPTSLPCRSSCDKVLDVCRVPFETSGQPLPVCENGIANLNNTSFPTNKTESSCIDLPVSNITSSSCPSPLIVDPFPDRQNNNTGSRCQNGCCLPCPFITNFYEEGAITSYASWSDKLRFISFGLVCFLILSYSIIPGKRNHPHLIVFCIFVSLFFFYFPNILAAPKGRQGSQCFDAITPASQFNSNMCTAQGFILVLGTHAVIMWIFVLALHLHLSAVWKNNFLKDRNYISYLLGWVVPWIFATCAFILGEFGTTTAPTCFLIRKYSNELLFYPLGFFVCLSIAIFACTLCYVAMVSYAATNKPSLYNNNMSMFHRTAQTTVRLINLQWRTSLLSLLMLTVYLYIFIFYIAELSKIDVNPSSIWFNDWLKCVVAGQGQKICAKVASPFLPKLIRLAVNDFLPAIVGIVIFGIFGLRREMFDEWKSLFKRKDEVYFLDDRKNYEHK